MFFCFVDKKNRTSGHIEIVNEFWFICWIWYVSRLCLRLGYIVSHDTNMTQHKHDKTSAGSNNSLYNYTPKQSLDSLTILFKNRKFGMKLMNDI